MKSPLLSIYLATGVLTCLSAQQPRAEVPGDADNSKEAEKVAARLSGTISNLGVIGVALSEFDLDYGSYPDAKTVAAVKKATGTAFKFEGGTANDYFRQMIATGGFKTEKYFQFGEPVKAPDNKFTTEAEALAPGECDFAYLPGSSSSTSSIHPARPVVVGPLVPGKMEFDPVPLGGRAVVLHADSSVMSYPINEKGEVIFKGKSLFDPNRPYWDKPPIVVWPKSPTSHEPPAQPLVDAGKAKVQAKVGSTHGNLEKIGEALVEFDIEYGSFPNRETAEDVGEVSGLPFKFEGNSSNDFFRQLIAAGLLKEERAFQLGEPAKPVDNKFNTEVLALAQGECDFSYLTGATAAAEPSRPVVVGPLVPGKMTFDPKPLHGQAAVLCVSRQVMILPINEKGEVVINGKSLFDPTQGYWGDKKPVVAWPK